MKKLDQKHPLAIPYQTNPKAPASDPAITKLIRDQLKLKNPTIFTDAVVAEITFSNTSLQVNTAVPVQATYNKKATPIYVKEAKNPDQGVYDALASFDQNSSIEIPYNQANPQAPASDAVVAPKIKTAMKSRNPIFTGAVLKKITFSNTPLQLNTPVPVQATYKEQATSIYIKEQNDPKIQKVINDLKTLNTPDTAVEIPAKYDGKYADDYGWFRAGSIIRFVLMWKLQSITLSNFREINFNHVQLKQGDPITVIATYKKQSTDILVKLQESPKPKPEKKVRKVLSRFTKTHRLKIWQVNGELKYIKASDELDTKKIRDALNKEGLSVDLTNQITFGADIIATSPTVPRQNQKWKTIATFKKGAVKILIYGITNYSV